MVDAIQGDVHDDVTVGDPGGRCGCHHPTGQMLRAEHGLAPSIKNPGPQSSLMAVGLSREVGDATCNYYYPPALTAMVVAHAGDLP